MGRLSQSVMTVRETVRAARPRGHSGFSAAHDWRVVCTTRSTATLFGARLVVAIAQITFERCG